MTPDDVLEVLDALDAAGIPAWVGGGWGVDALVGKETRGHYDVDIAVPGCNERQAIEAMTALGFRIIEEQDWRPVRVLLEDSRGRAVDVHPLVFDASPSCSSTGAPATGAPARLMEMLPLESGEKTSGHAQEQRPTRSTRRSSRRPIDGDAGAEPTSSNGLIVSNDCR